MKKRLKAIICLCFAAVALSAQEPEFGMASYYDDDFQGGRTAYGEVYDKSKLTAAHKLYPYGSMIKVTRLDNKKSVTVKVIDKGPFIKGRVVDLSKAAAERLGLVNDGIAEVKVELISTPGKEDELAKDENPLAGDESVITPPSFEDNTPLPSTRTVGEKTETGGEGQAIAEATPAKKVDKPVKEETPKTTTATKKASSKTSSATTKQKSTDKLVGKDYTQYGLYKIEIKKPAKKGYGVQVASLSSYENLMRQITDLQAKWFDNVLVSIEKAPKNASTYKIILGPFATEAEAKAYQSSLKKKHKMSGFVVDLNGIKY